MSKAIELKNYTNDEIYKKIYDAYIFTFSLVATDVFRKVNTNIEKPGEKKAPENQFWHDTRLWSAKDNLPGGPNMDTIYSGLILNLTNEPYIFTKPETDRFFTFLILDAYCNYTEILGTGGLGGNSKAIYALIGPNYKGNIPNDVIPVYIPTNIANVCIRTRVFEEEKDAENIKKIQQQLDLRPLAYYGKEYTPPKGEYNPDYDYQGYYELKNLEIDKFFNVYNSFVGTNPPVQEDQKVANGFLEFGIGAGENFKMDQFEDEGLKERLSEIPKEVAKIMFKGGCGNQIRNNWSTMPRDVVKVGCDYLLRGYVAQWGPGCNPQEAAIYFSTKVDKNNYIIDGNNNYIIHFDKDNLPPCKEYGYWSISPYTEGDLYLIPNEIDRYKLGGESQMKYNEDGSLDIFVQSGKPSDDKVSNWLPVNKGKFTLVFRIYIPDDTVLSGEWKPPFVEKI